MSLMKIKPNHFSNMINVKVKMLSDRKYTIRDSRDRYFFPDEWKVFYDSLKTNQKITFNFLINTGARINEIRNVKLSDVDFNRNSIILRVTKTRNKDGSMKVRVIPVSSQFIKYLRHYANEKNLKPDDGFNILSTPAANIAMKNHLREIGIKDWQMFSIHNIRKTLETWLLALDIDGLKIVKHFGHSFAIAGKFYISSDVFNFEDKQIIREIVGDLFQKQS